MSAFEVWFPTALKGLDGSDIEVPDDIKNLMRSAWDAGIEEALKVSYDLCEPNGNGNISELLFDKCSEISKGIKKLHSLSDASN